jgi:FAD/FMN-containing dehydrogenase
MVNRTALSEDVIFTDENDIGLIEIIKCISLMQKIKLAFDEKNILNPGKICF